MNCDWSCLLPFHEIIVFFVLQVFPQNDDVVELFIYLTEPCHVCQLLLTVSHGADDLTYPATVDVRTGRNFDGLKLILEVCMLFKTFPSCFMIIVFLLFNVRRCRGTAL